MKLNKLLLLLKYSKTNEESRPVVPSVDPPRNTWSFESSMFHGEGWSSQSVRVRHTLTSRVEGAPRGGVDRLRKVR